MKFRKIVILIFLCLSFRSYGQEIIPKIGYTLSNGQGVGGNVSSSSQSGIGLILGVDYKSNISNRVSLRYGLTYSEKKFSENNVMDTGPQKCYHNCPGLSPYVPGTYYDEHIEWKFRHLQVPFFFDYYLTGSPKIRNKPSLLITFGAFLGACLSCDKNVKNTFNNKTTELTDGAEPGWLIGAGFVFSGIRIDGAYAMGLNEYQLKTLQLTVGVPISLVKLPNQEEK